MEPNPEVLSALETAIQIEKDGLVFYTEAAKQVDDPKGKKMFQTLARDEQLHLQLFENAREALLNKKNWPSLEKVKEISPEKSIRQPVFPTGDEIKLVKIPDRQLAALRQGLQSEEDSILFYSKQKEQIDDPDAKKMYAYLIEQEEGHRTILQGELDYLTGTGFWFDVQEFNLEA
ncbi:MAG: ferritin family protein [Chloroflexi bacterium]|nr:ferritin family protein [Chloroflexota bacterium]